MQVKITASYYFISTSKAITKNTISVRKAVEKLASSYIVGENVHSAAAWENIWQFLKKLSAELP